LSYPATKQTNKGQDITPVNCGIVGAPVLSSGLAAFGSAIRGAGGQVPLAIPNHVIAHPLVDCMLVIITRFSAAGIFVCTNLYSEAVLYRSKAFV